MMEQNDVRKANDLIRELRQHSSAYGNGLQRMAYYFMEALVSFNPFLVRRCYTLFVLWWKRDEGVVAF
jgi:hypothetical protein